MRLLYDDTVLELDGTETATELAELEHMPTSVKQVSINAKFRRMRLPRFKAHVKIISLYDDATLEGPVIFHEGLEILRMSNVSTETPMAYWSFPASLIRLDAYKWTEQPLDLRACTADQISLVDFGPGDEVLLPDVLDQLEIGGEGGWLIPRLPPNLRTLLLSDSDYSFQYRAEANPSVETLIMGGNQALPSTWDIFPNLAELELSEYRGLRRLDLPTVQKLTLSDWKGRTVLRVIAPELETLVITHRKIRRVPTFDDVLVTLGQTVVALELKEVRGFPEIDNWDRLSSVTITRCELELPYIQWLEELILDRPVQTNGVMIETIDEYKAAWGFRSKAKRAARMY